MEGDCVVGYCGDVVAGEKGVGEIEREVAERL